MKPDRRPSAAARGYGGAWRKARAEFLAQHPWCRFCAEVGRQMRATVVDHIVPHRGDAELFWDRSNWQSLCDTHHSSTKQAQEKGGSRPAIGVNGWPA